MKRFDFSVIKTLRLKRGLTAEQLASKAKVTRATIAKMETGFNNPTVQTLEALAAVFNLTSSDLLRMSEGSRLEHARVEEFSRPGYAGHRISLKQFEMFYLTARKGTCIESEANLHEDTSEICFVLSGQLRLSVGDQTVSMEAGKAIRFNALHEHRLEVLEDAVIILIHHNKL